MKKDISGLKNDVTELKNDVKIINGKMDAIYNHTADLTEFRTEVNDKLDVLNNVEEVTKINCYDIAKLRAAH